FFFFSSRRRHTRFSRDWSSDVCSSDLSFSSMSSSSGTGSSSTMAMLQRSAKSPSSSSTYATPPDMPAAKLRPVLPITTTMPPVMYSQPWSPTPSTTAMAPELRTAKRSEEHTSELQSRENLVCRLLLEKKNTTIRQSPTYMR